MKKNIIILIAVFFNLFFSISAFAELTLVSPEPGEGPVQIAERYNVDPAAFIKLNKKLGRFTDAKKPSLVYTWQKFVLPEDAKMATKETAALSNVEEESKSVVENSSGLKSKPADNSEKNISLGLKHQESFKDKIFNGMKKLGNIEFDDAIYKFIPWMVSAIIFLIFVCIAILINLMVKKNVKDDKKTSEENIQNPMFFIGFSDAFSGYCILPSNKTMHKIEIKSTLCEISEVAAGLCAKYEALGPDVLFGYDLKKNTDKWSILRNLEESERNEFKNTARKILNRSQVGVDSGEDTSWSP